MTTTFPQLRLPTQAEKSSPGCPFHPTRTLESHNGKSSWSAQHVGLKEGLDYVRLVSDGSKGKPLTEIDFGDDRLVLGNIYTGEGRIHSAQRIMGTPKPNEWFRFSSKSVILESNHIEPSQIDLILCTRDIAKRLQVFESAEADSGMGVFASGESALAFHSTSMNVESMYAARRIAGADLNSLQQRLRLEAGILSWISEILAQGLSDFPTSTSSINTIDREALEQIVRLFHSSPGRDYTLAELSQQVGMNENKFKSAFKEVHGQTAFAFLRTVRMEHASRLLREDRASVIEVANEVGYSNPSHFARAFKEQHGLLPKAYQCVHRPRASYSPKAKHTKRQLLAE